MSFSSGTFSLFTPGNPVVTGTTIASTWANNTLNDIATGLSTCVLKDGSQTITANIPMSSFKITGLGVPTTNGDALSYGSAGSTTTTLNATASVVTPAVLSGGVANLIVGGGGGNWIFNGTTGDLTPTSGLDNVFSLGTAALRIKQAFTPIIDSGTTGSGSLKTNNGTTIFQWANSGTVGVGATPAATGKGITFPASQSASSDANTLDDYSEGTWTPSIGGSATYTTQTGTFTKIGRLVYIHCKLTINAIGTGSTTIISGLPFAPTADTVFPCSNFATIASSVVFLSFLANSGATTAQAQTLTAAATAVSNVNAVFGNGAQLTIDGCYQTT